MNTNTKTSEPRGNGTSFNIPGETKNLSEKIEKMSSKVGSDVGEAVGQISEKAGEYMNTSRDYVESHPLQSVVVAFTVGIAAGSLLTLAMRKSH
jgi:ElaB/YqjD/DUF883 family membrane-anchored ribosome-binding protein